MTLQKETLIRWSSRGGKYWLELIEESLPDCEPAFSYKGDNCGGFLGHCSFEAAIARCKQELECWPSAAIQVPANVIRREDGKPGFPVNTWRVTLMARKRGAIGIFYEYIRLVRAEVGCLVEQWAIQDANDAEMEVSHFVKKERLA